MVHEILLKHFKDPEKIVNIIYSNGGLTTSGYGYLSRGYGGGIEQDDFHTLLWLNGYMSGLGNQNPQEGHNILKALNLALVEKFPSEINKDNVPFVNLTHATI
jgi:hypothetical protein